MTTMFRVISWIYKLYNKYYKRVFRRHAAFTKLWPPTMGNRYCRLEPGVEKVSEDGVIDHQRIFCLSERKHSKNRMWNTVRYKYWKKRTNKIKRDRICQRRSANETAKVIIAFKMYCNRQHSKAQWYFVFARVHLRILERMLNFFKNFCWRWSGLLIKMQQILEDCKKISW